MTKYIEQLGRDVIIYGFTRAFAFLIGFVATLIYANLFSTFEFGLLEILQTVLILAGCLVSAGTDSSHGYFFFKRDHDTQERRIALVSTILQWRLIGGVLIVTIGLFLTPLLNRNIFDGYLTIFHFVLGCIGVIIFQIESQLNDIVRFSYDSLNNVLIHTLYMVGTWGLGLTFVYFFNLGITGYLIGYSLGAAPSLLVSIWKTRSYIDLFRIYPGQWSSLKFSLPFLTNNLLIWVLDISDKWMIKFFLGIEAVAIYSVGSKIAMTVLFIAIVFRTACTPIAMEILHKDDERAGFVAISKLYLGIVFIIVTIVSTTAPYLIDMLFIPSYYESYKVVGMLCISNAFYGFLLISQSGILKAEHPSVISLIVFCSVVVNVISNLILIPIYGISGACVATMGSMILRNFISLVISEKKWSIGLPIFIFLIQTVLVITAVSIPLYFGYIFFSITLCSLCAILIIFTALDSRTVKMVKSILAVSS